MKRESSEVVANKGMVAAIMMVALLMASFDGTSLAAVLPAVVDSIGGSELYAWPTAAYLVTCSVAILLCGGLSGIFGARRVFCSGIMVFALASVGCAASQTMETLISFRLISGLGGGLMEAGVFVLCADLFPPRERGKMMGTITTMYSAGSMLGPLAGALLAGLAGWQSIFWVKLPFCAAAIAMALLWIRPDDQLPLTRSAFKVVERTTLANRRVRACITQAFLVQIALFGMMVFVPRYAEKALGIGIEMSALLTVPPVIALMLGSVIAGRMFARTGKMRVPQLVSLAVGAAFALAATGLMAVRMGSAALVGTTAMGACIGMSLPLQNIAAQTAVLGAESGRATSVVMFFRSLGGATGSTICGVILGGIAIQYSYLPVGVLFAFGLAVAAFTALAFPLALGYPKGMPTESQSSPDAVNAD